MAIWILLAEAICVYGLVLFAHSLRRRFGLAHYYALVGGLTAVMSWVTDAHVKVIAGPVTFLVGSTVFFTALLLGIFVIYVFDGPKAARVAISTVAGISVLVPVLSLVLHLQMRFSSTGPLADVPVPSLRINTASVLTTLADMVFLAVAWEYMNHRFQRVPLALRAFFVLLGVMLLDVVLFNTGAFAGSPNYYSVLAGTFSERVAAAIVATPVLWAYMTWETRRGGAAIRRRPILAILKELTDTKDELSIANRELARRHLAEQALRDSERRYRELVEHAMEGIVVVQRGRVALANRQACALLGLAPEASLGTPFAELFATEDTERAAAAVGSDAARESPRIDDFKIRRPSGCDCWLQTRTVGLTWQGAPAALVFLADITERRRAEATLIRRANTDALTGLVNRLHFLELAERAFLEAVRLGRPLALVTLDADDFKSVNDRYGHPAGDQVLQHVARLLKGELRDVDAVGRMGGEEFAVLLPGLDVHHAQAVAERLRNVICALPADTDRGRISLTVSAGVADRGPDTLTLKTLIRASDDALLTAKQGGRNRVEVARLEAVAESRSA